MTLTCHRGFKKRKGTYYQSTSKPEGCVWSSFLLCILWGSCFRCWAWAGRSKVGICSDLEDRGSCLHTSAWPAMAPLSSSSCVPGRMPGFCLFWTPSPSFRGHRLSSHRTEGTGWSRPPFSFIPPELELLILLSLPLPFLWQPLRTAEHTCPSAGFIKEALPLEERWSWRQPLYFCDYVS